MKNLTNYIVSAKKKVYFVSPHFDDAIYSAGALMVELSKQGVPITVINVFSKAKSPSTLSGQAFLKKCGYQSPESLFKDRIKEDNEVIKSLKGASVINLGYEDALWRKNNKKSLIPEISHVYPTFKLHIASGKISIYDKKLISNLKQNLERIIPKNAIVFGPLGVGKHVDHVIVNKVIDELKRDKVFWVDFPYSQRFKDLGDNIKNFVFKRNKKEKEALVRGYKSQFKAIFGKKLKLDDEFYSFAIKDIKNRVSVCIPAHNEESSIGQLIDSIFTQAGNQTLVDEVLVYCDGCTDKTVDIVSKKQIKEKRIKIIVSKKRSGLSAGQNTLLSKAKNGIIVLINSDIKITDSLFIEKISLPIISGVDLVSVRLSPLPPKSFFEKILYKGTLYKETIFEEHKKGSNVFSCHGPARSFSKKLAKNIKFKYDTGEDAYSYFYAIKNGFKYQFTQNTEVFYRLPNNFRDYLNQSKRFVKSSQLNSSTFGEEFVNKESKIGAKIFVKTVLRHPFLTLENTAYLVMYCLLLLITKVNFKARQAKDYRIESKK